MRSYRNILSIGLLVASLAYTLCFVFMGFGNHQDPLYWLYKYEHLEGGWMAVGTLLTGGTLVRLFGAQLLSLRLAAWLCVVAGIALPYVCLLNKDQRRENLHWLALTFVLMGYGAFQEFSPGTLSVLLLSALWVTQSPVVLGLAIAARFPNILALLVLIPLWKKRSIWNIPIAALTAGVIYLLGYFFVTPAATDAAMNSHAWSRMLTMLWMNSGRLAGYMLLAVGVLALSKNTSDLQPSNLQPLKPIIVGLVLALFVAQTMKPHQWYNIDMTYLLSALCLVIALANKSQITNHKFEIINGVMLLSIATLGTDTAWLKLFPAVLCLLPVAATYFAEEGRRYLWIVLAILSGVVAIRMTTNSIGNNDLTRVQTISAVTPYRGILIREAEEHRLLQYKADYDSLQTISNNLKLQTSNVLSIGQESHLMRAVTGCEAARYNEFWSNIFDSVYTDKYREIIRAERPVVFCSYSPQFKTKPFYKDRESAFENMLREEGYRELDRAKYKYMIYIPQDNE